MEIKRKIISPIFMGIEDVEIVKIMTCSNARIEGFKRSELIMHGEEGFDKLGVVLEGAVNMIREDEFGSSFVILTHEQGEPFGLSMAIDPEHTEDLCVYAATGSTVLLMDASRLMHACSNNCTFHTKLLSNLLNIVVKMNMELVKKQCHMSQKTLRMKLVSYLTEQCGHAGTECFCITLNRQQLADYLGVDRSALSAELSKMKRDGLIDYSGREFKLNAEPIRQLYEK